MNSKGADSGQPRRRKSSKGTVQVKNSNGRLQLVFTYGGKRRYLSLGFDDTPQTRELANMRANQIRLDMISGNFDETLGKYKPESALSVSEPEVFESSESPLVPSLAELWEKFLEYKRPQCSDNTMYHMYGTYTGYLERLPTHDLSRAAEIRDFALKTFPVESCKRFLVRLNACCEWAMQSGMLSESPFKGMAQEIKPPKSQKKTEDTDIFPFTTDERDLILQAIREDTFCSKHSGYKHSFYANYVEFLFLTGCRPSEAIALQGKHISADLSKISFEQVVISTRSGRKIRQGLKTQERRRFPCNAQLKELLKSVKPSKFAPKALLFPGYSGGILDTPSFRKNVWKSVLEGLGIEYRKPYQTRHTFITMALERGLDAKDVARLVGNSPEVIYRHYAGNKRELFIPEL
jgi:integrase